MADHRDHAWKPLTIYCSDIFGDGSTLLSMTEPSIEHSSEEYVPVAKLREALRSEAALEAMRISAGHFGVYEDADQTNRKLADAAFEAGLKKLEEWNG